jgi:hypothetical protein
MGANLILPAGSAAAADSTPAEDPVVRSLRFDGSAYLHRTVNSSETTWTLAFWMKRAWITPPDTNNRYIFSINDASGLFWDDNAYADGTLVYYRGGSSVTTSTAKYTDPSSWYHVCLVCSSSTANLYINGELSPNMGSMSLSQNTVTSIRFANYGTSNGHKAEQYLADIYFIEGEAKSPTDFIESNDYGGYKPKAYTGSFGTKGFHIDAQPTHDADLLVTSVGRNDGDTTFVDVAAGHQINSYGGTEHSIAVGNPFTGDDRAIYFDGSSALTMPDSTDWEPSGDFTYEAWIMPTWSSAPAYSLPFGHGSSDGQDVNMGHSVLIKNGTLYLTGSFGSTYHHPNYSSSGSGFAVSANEWTHVAVVRDGNTIRYYKNGVQESTFTVSGSATAESNVFALGRSGGLTTYPYTGYIADFRITHDAEYPNGTTFTTPTSPHSTTSDTKVRIQPQSSDTTWHDEEGNHTISTVGSPTRTASTPYDAAAKSTAMYFDGNDTLTGPNDLAFGTGAFTIEFWYQHVSDINGGVTGATSDIVISKGRRHTGYQGWLLFTHNNGIDKVNWVAYKVNGSSGNNYSLDANSTGVSLAHDGDWHHIAVTRDGSGNMGLFIDGTRYADATGYGGVIDSAYYLHIAAGRTYSSGTVGHYANCYLYDVRITKGEARYDPTSSSVTKPSAPFELNPVYIGGDQSGNKNHFTPTNISSHDVMLDVPTKNYATLNPLDKGSSTLLLEGNCGISQNTNSWVHHARSTFSVSSGKWYWECTDNNGWGGGFWKTGIAPSGGTIASALSGAYTYYAYDGSGASSGSGWSSGDIIGIALDLDNGTCDIYKNNSSMGTLVASGLSGEYSPYHDSYNSQTIYNFGQDPTFAGGKTSGQDTSQSEFYYAPPTGFKSLNTSNLPSPTVTPAENFEALTYTGSGSTRSITGLDFQPDLVWIKDRTTGGAGGFHCIHDSVRGDDGTHKYILSSDNTITTDTTYSGYGVTSFNSDGFSIINGGSLTNDSSRNYVAWNWKAHQSPSSGPTTTYTVKVEDNSGDAWDYSGSYYDSSTYLPSVYMEIFENRNSSLVSLGKVAVRTYDSSGSYISEQSEQTYTLECADLDAIAVKWHYDTSGDGQQYDSPNSYNDYLNDQKITILDGTTSEWTTNNYSNADGTSYNYSPPSGWANGDTLKSATTSYNGSDTATLTSGGSSGPTEQYNADAGFTMISYAGDGSTDGDTQTLDHSLGVPLEFVIAKARTSNDGYDTGNWIVWHKDLSTGKYLYLNSSSSQRTEASGYNLISTATSGTQHQVVVNNGSDNSSYNYHYLNSGPSNGTGEDYILYGWAGIESFSQFGKYTGNGSSNGPMVHLSFRPKFFMYKQATGTTNWVIVDAERETYNTVDLGLFPNLSTYEQAGSSENYKMDFLSNGVKIRTSASGTNANNQTFIYAAFAETPFKHANAR